MNHLINRIFSAIENSENLILDQLKNDIYSAIDNKEIDTEEYRIVADGKDILIHDKIHNESTKVTPSTEGFRLNDQTKSVKKFSRSKSHRYLVDENEHLIAIGSDRSLGRLKNAHNNWKLIDYFDWKKYETALSKKFSNLSDSNQKLFTLRYRRYAVLDERGKLKYLVDLNNARDLVSRNLGWSAIKESTYNSNLNDKLSNFSEVTRNKIIKDIYSAVENC